MRKMCPQTMQTNGRIMRDTAKPHFQQTLNLRERERQPLYNSENAPSPLVRSSYSSNKVALLIKMREHRSPSKSFFASTHELTRGAPQSSGASVLLFVACNFGVLICEEKTSSFCLFVRPVSCSTAPSLTRCVHAPHGVTARSAHANWSLSRRKGFKGV